MAVVMRRHFLLFLLFLYILAPQLSLAQARFGHLPGKSYAERYKSLDSIFLHYDLYSKDSITAFKTLDSIKAMAVERDDEELIFEMDLMHCIYYTRGWQADKSRCGPCLEDLLKQVKKAGNRQLQVRIHSSLSYWYRYDKPDNGLSLEHKLSSYYLVKDMSPAEFPNKMDILSGIGGSYYTFGDYESAKTYLLEALAAGPSYKPWFNINLYNNLGLIYQHQGNHDSAIYFFNKTIETAQKHGHTHWVAIAGGNIGTTYYLQGRYTESVPLLEAKLRECLHSGDSVSAATALIKLADISLKQNNAAAAGPRLNEARTLLANAKDPYPDLKDLFPLLAKYHAATGNASFAYVYADSALKAQDSFHHDLNHLMMARAQQRVEGQEHMAQVAQLTAEKKFQTFQRNGLVAIVLLLGAVALLFINRQKIAHSRRQEKLEADKRLVQSELSGAVAQLEAFTRSIHEKNELIEKFATEIDNLKLTGIAPNLEQNEVLLQLQESTILTEDQWKDFKILFEKVHSGFLNRLRERLPDLSPAEVRFMALSKLKLNNKEMAGILGISPDAVRMNRHRLRKKLNLAEEVGIEELADTV